MNDYSEQKASDCWIEGYLFAANSKHRSFSEVVKENPYISSYNGYINEWYSGAKEGFIEKGNSPTLSKETRAFVLFRYGIDLKNYIRK